MTLVSRVLKVLREISKSGSSLMPDERQQKIPALNVTVQSELKLPPELLVAWEAERADQHARNRTDRLRLFTEVLVLAAVVVGFGLSWAQMAATRRAVEIAQRSTEIAARQLEATDRPWIKATVSASTPLTITGDDKDVAILLRTAMKNIGRSVAQNVALHIAIYPQAWNPTQFTEPIKRQQEICERPRGTDGFLNMTLFPEEEGVLSSSLTMSKAQIAQAAAEAQPGFPYPPLHPMVVGCVTYEFVGSTGGHRTNFAYSVERIDPRFPLELKVFDAGNLPTDLSSISLRRFPNAKTHFAD